MVLLGTGTLDNSWAQEPGWMDEPGRWAWSRCCWNDLRGLLLVQKTSGSEEIECEVRDSGLSAHKRNRVSGEPRSACTHAHVFFLSSWDTGLGDCRQSWDITLILQEKGWAGSRWGISGKAPEVGGGSRGVTWAVGSDTEQCLCLGLTLNMVHGSNQGTVASVCFYFYRFQNKRVKALLAPIMSLQQERRVWIGGAEAKRHLDTWGTLVVRDSQALW